MNIFELLTRPTRAWLLGRTAPPTPVAVDEKARDWRLRGECLNVAQAYGGKNLDETIRCAQRVYDWMNGGPAPTEPAGETRLAVVRRDFLERS